MFNYSSTTFVVKNMSSNINTNKICTQPSLQPPMSVARNSNCKFPNERWDHSTKILLFMIYIYQDEFVHWNLFLLTQSHQ